jgi:hypothetical protein
MAEVSEELIASIIKVLVNIYQTMWCNIPKDSHLHTECCDSLSCLGKQKFEILNKETLMTKLLTVVDTYF